VESRSCKTPSGFARSVPGHRDKVEIKCMGPIGEKHQQNQKCICSSLILSIVSKIKLMDNKIMSVEVKHLSDQIARPNGKIIYLYLYFLYLPEIECATF